MGCRFSCTPEQKEAGPKGDVAFGRLLGDVSIFDGWSLPRLLEVFELVGDGMLCVTRTPSDASSCVLPPKRSSSDSAGLERSWCSIRDAAS